MNIDTQDALLSGLLVVGQHFGVTINPEQVTHGLPLKSGKLTPDLFTQCAERAGLTAMISSRGLRKIHPSTLPVVIPLKGGLVFVMTRWETKKQVRGKVISEGSATEVEFTLKELNARYLGYIFLIKSEDSDERIDLVSNVSKKKRHWFWSTLWHFRSVYMKVAVATLCINFMGLASSVFIMNVYDRVVPNEATDTLYALAIGVLIAYTMEFCLKMLRTVFVDTAGRRIDVMLGGEVFGKVLATKFQNKPVAAGTLAAQARSYETVREFFTSATVATLIDVPFIFLFVGVVFLLGKVAAIPLLVGVVVALALSLILQIPINRAVGKSYQTSNQRYALMVESVNSLETVKATCSESELQARMENCVKDSAKAEGQSRGYSQLGSNSLALIAHLVSTFTVIFGYFQVTANEMSMGAMIACVLLCGRAMSPLNSFAALMMRLQQSMRSLKSLNEMMSLEDERDRKEKISVHSFKPRIEASNLKFGFGDNPEEILKGLNFKIEPGERVALVGKIGCGKTTLMRMLMALYEPREGSVTVSGLDTRQWSSPALRKHFGYLPQDPALLYGTLGSNLMAGSKGKVTEEDLIRAVELAGLSDFIANLPEGLATPISEGGKSVSGGQRQSIFLARALLRSPEILLLDEPTSSMDQITEKLVLNNLDTYMKEDPNRAMIISTHRQSILSIVDRVIVLDKGKIVSDGPKKKVVAQKDLHLKQSTGPSRVRPGSHHSVELPS